MELESRGWGDKILNRCGTCLSRIKVKEPWSIYSLLDQVKQIWVDYLAILVADTFVAYLQTSSFLQEPILKLESCF